MARLLFFSRAFHGGLPAGAGSGYGSVNISVNYKAVLETAADVARGMSHLHANKITHSDLKV